MIPIEPEEQENKETARAPEASGLDELKKALADEKAKSEAYLDGWQRERADFINYKRRTEQERAEIGKYANSELICCILPVLDDFERAFNNMPPEVAGSGWVEGVRAVERKLRSILEAQGLSEIKAVGEPFDPNLHEAVMTGKGKDGIVIAELQKGYKLHDKVLRPAKVMVGNGEEESKEE